MLTTKLRIDGVKMLMKTLALLWSRAALIIGQKNQTTATRLTS